METGKPLISILMAVYEPRMDWLKEQLNSLEAQTYPNLRLYIRDDCSPTVPFEEIEGCVRECIRSFPYKICRNEENLGSNRTFERLTQEAEGEYFAYCDQDDVWLPEKLAALAAALEREDSELVYCDMCVINETGKIMADSLKKARPRLRYLSGKNLSAAYFFRNCTAGCSMLLRARSAKKALPFPLETVCDQWLAIVASLQGGVAFVPQGLARYRQHSGNQTGILKGVVDWKSYREKRLLPMLERMDFYKKYTQPEAGMEAFVEARLARRILGIWRGRKYSWHEAVFEIFTSFLPERAVKALLRRIQ